MKRLFLRVGVLLTLLVGGSHLAICASQAQSSADAAITGMVVDVENGRPIVGASIVLEGTVRGTTTDRVGAFKLTGIRDGDYTLKVSRMGFESVRRPIGIRNGAAQHLVFELGEQPLNLDEVLAVADRAYSTASSRTARGFDLVARPTRSAQDLLQLTPGLITAQHAGGGKAEQIFLRGFDADHGTDVAVALDGMPVNMVSHGHGQGYADLHFVIPELVERVDVAKGPYFVRYGNFATAGAFELFTRDHLDENLIRLEGGSFNSAGLTMLYQVPTWGASNDGAYLAAQYNETDGPFKHPQDFRRVNVFGKYHAHLTEHADLSVSISGFASEWNASGQIPMRAIKAGEMSRFGAIDALEGGATSRQDVNIVYRRDDGHRRSTLQTYAGNYDFELFSNFTFFLENPEAGDMIEQTDDRHFVGLNGSHEVRHGLRDGVGTTTFGGGFRSDDVEVSLRRSPNRLRTTTLADAAITERNFFLWVSEDLVFTPWLRLQLGLRGDYFTYNVDDHLVGTSSVLPHASGYVHQGIISPKANLVVSPLGGMDIFINVGTGFHSTDARSAVIAEKRGDSSSQNGGRDLAFTDSKRSIHSGGRKVGALPRAVGGETGFRVAASDRVHLAAALWLLDLEHEFVYVGDGGFAELSGPTRRYGLDLELRARIRSWLWTDADLNLSDGYFREADAHENEIPLAPRVTATAGLTVVRPDGFEGTLRLLHVGDRPADEAAQITARGQTLVNLTAAYRIRAVRIHLALENAWDVEWNEAQFAYTSRLADETRPYSDLHFTPGAPRNVRLGLSYTF